MSLISQNAQLNNNGVNEIKRLVEDGVEEDNDTLNVKNKKKKKLDQKEEESIMEEVKEMKKLENVLFGSLYSPVESGKEGDEGEDENGAEKVSDLYFIDRSADDVHTVYQEGAELSDGLRDGDDNERSLQRKPVWVDDGDKNITVNIAKVNRLRKLRKKEDESLILCSDYVARLRALHVKLNPATDWARKSTTDGSSDDEDNGAVVSRGYDDVDDILRTNEDLVVKSRSKLLPGHLEYSRLVDANIQDPASGSINSVQFHRNAQLLLAAGLDRKLRFFQIDGKRNTKIESIFLEDYPIKKASFLPDGSQVIVSGTRKFFYSYDLVKASVDKIGPLVGRNEESLAVFEVSPDSQMIAFTGNEGYILLVSTKTKQLVGTLKMNGTISSVAFAENGQQLLSSGGDGQIYHWDLRTMTCLHKAVDEGCIKGTALCTSPGGGTLFAAGSNSGIVNVYNREEFLGGKRKPIKAIENLTTKVDFMRFNHDSQILAICSTKKKSSLRLIHIPSYTVFSNWPPPNTSLRFPRCIDFSPGGGFMAVGNNAGTVLLYKLHHYQNA
ncbi:hypothetical protein RJT34_30972 [Clitoria ternatea]|uniref:U3 small nucleolar RNA-associated protein 18 homolog n=1 Tax=Clitoria ternatea TaxID=43366 RepID=A0AAN9EUF2_CLITE